MEIKMIWRVMATMACNKTNMRRKEWEMIFKQMILS